MVIILKIRFDAIKARISRLPALVRWLALVVAFLGIFGTMPTSYLYGALGGEMAAAVGRFVDSVLGLTWPVFRVLIGLTTAIISVIALIAWALIIWWIIGAGVGFILNAAFRFFRQNAAGRLISSEGSMRRIEAKGSPIRRR